MDSDDNYKSIIIVNISISYDISFESQEKSSPTIKEFLFPQSRIECAISALLCELSRINFYRLLIESIRFIRNKNSWKLVKKGTITRSLCTNQFDLNTNGLKYQIGIHIYYVVIGCSYFPKVRFSKKTKETNLIWNLLSKRQINW